MDFRTAVYQSADRHVWPVLPALSAAEWVRWCETCLAAGRGAPWAWLLTAVYSIIYWLASVSPANYKTTYYDSDILNDTFHVSIHIQYIFGSFNQFHIQCNLALTIAASPSLLHPSLFEFYFISTVLCRNSRSQKLEIVPQAVAQLNLLTISALYLCRSLWHFYIDRPFFSKLWHVLQNTLTQAFHSG